MRSARTRARTTLSATLLAGLLAAGCATSGSGTAGLAPSTDGATTPHPSGPSKAVLVERDNANGTTVHVRVGDRIELILASSYWAVRGSSAPSVLRQDGPAVHLPPSPRNCPPGLGCRPVRAYFTALAAGIALITAHRSTCGEALRCVGSRGRFSITVAVR
jgi:hypothetical protein